MPENEINVITGAFSYTGKYITRRLLEMGKQVRTLTGHPDNPNPFGAQVEVHPFHFGQPEKLAKSLEGATTLYNTYWVRFAHGATTFEKAVENTSSLLQAAEKAGVRRIVHVSITNPDEASPLPYFHGKALLEQAIRRSRLEYAIVRPTVIFGDEDILINNIAWLLRRFPLFPIFGQGDYRLQPIYVEDMADLVVQAGQSHENLVLDAVGPDIFTFDEMVRMLASILDRHVIITHVPPGLGFALARLIEPFIGDVLITRDEIAGLMANLLISHQEPGGTTHLIDWLRAHKNSVGKVYASELQRHYTRRIG
ncbi:MAG TPA: NAD(P)H-binding protein [Ktedonobacteraceae bacterium]|nr:NAD(P)H-binding protein [Ktedonobacteraceae bacterium]